MALHKEA